MKNIVLGVMGCMIAIYTVLSCLSIYSISARKNEMENCLSRVMAETMNQYAETEYSESYIASKLESELRSNCSFNSKISVEVCVCDMEKGELTVRMIETFQLPGGKEKTIEKSLSCHAQERL